MHGKPNSYREFFLKKWADFVISNDNWSKLQAKFINAQIKNIKLSNSDEKENAELRPEYVEKLKRIEKEGHSVQRHRMFKK